MGKTIPSKIIVHTSPFHADDVMCVAIMKCANPQIKIIRQGKVEADDYSDETIIADIGLGQYDHHQSDVPLRTDSHKRAACGLIFDDYKQFLFKTKQGADTFERDCLYPLEDADNGVSHNTFYSYIFALNVPWTVEGKKFREKDQEAFTVAVERCTELIRLWQRDEALILTAQPILTKAIGEMKNRVVVLPKFLPWQDEVCKTDALFVVYPNSRAGYTLQAVPEAPGSYVPRLKMPIDKNTMAGCTFSHVNGFLAVFETVEQARQAGIILVKMYEKEPGL